MMFRYLVVLLVIPFSNLLAQGQPQKVRLSDAINNYQPTITPVVNLKGNMLFLDRKYHPQNVGNIHDDDDIWMSIKMRNGSWTVPHNLSLFNTSGSNVLFSILPDGNSALVYNDFINKEADSAIGTFGLLSLNDGYFSPFEIDNYYNLNKNFYGFLNYKNKALLLSIEREDSQGELDLYVSFYNGNNWSTPLNLGSDINTSKTEVAPFLAYDNKTLYYASDGINGRGKLDLYMSKRLDESWKKWSQPVNLGPLFNSEFNESSIWLTALSDTAYIVSGDSATGREGIYYVTLPDKYKPDHYTIVSGIITDENNNVTNARVVIKNNSNREEQSLQSFDGEYIFIISDSSSYSLKVSKDGFINYEESFSTDNKEIEWLKKNINLKKEPDAIKQNKKDSIQTLLYFETGKYDLKKDEVEKLRDFFNRWKETRIKIEGHADPRGEENFNYNLSAKRAKITKEYLVKLGVPAEKIDLIAKGESEPVSDDNKLNRRVIVFTEK